MTEQPELLTNDTETQDLVITRIFDAPRELVWKAWTDPEHMMRWWGPEHFSSPLAKMDVRVGGEYLLAMRTPDGQTMYSRGVYKEVEAPARLVMTDSFSDEHGNTVPPSHYGMDDSFPEELIITVTLEEENGKTKMTVRHSGMPAGYMKDMTSMGWNSSFDKLADALTFSAAAGEDTKVFVLTRTFDAPQDLVWKAWTEAERLAQWWGPKGFKVRVEKLDLQPGGIFHYYLHADNGHEMWGRFAFREVEAPNRLAYVSSFSNPEGEVTRAPFSDAWPLETLNIITMTENEGKTTITLRGVPINATPEEYKMWESAFSSMDQGFSGTMEQLDEYLKGAK